MGAVRTVPRPVPVGGGGVRVLPATELTAIDGRVWLQHNGTRVGVRVDELVARSWPENRRPQRFCRHGHLLRHPRDEPPGMGQRLIATHGPVIVRVWGSGNRVCVRCCPDCPDSWPGDNRYSLHYGVSTPDYAMHRATPVRGAHLPSLYGGAVGDGDYAAYHAKIYE